MTEKRCIVRSYCCKYILINIFLAREWIEYRYSFDSVERNNFIFRLEFIVIEYGLAEEGCIVITEIEKYKFFKTGTRVKFIYYIENCVYIG